MRHTFAAIALTILLSGCEQAGEPTGPSGGPSLAAGVIAHGERTVTLLPFNAPNTCTGETIHFDATEISLSTIFLDANLGIHQVTVDRFVVSGVSSTGNRSTAIVVSQTVTNNTSGDATTTTILLRGRLISQGGEANATKDIQMIVTLVDGQPTANLSVEKFTCTQRIWF